MMDNFNRELRLLLEGVVFGFIGTKGLQECNRGNPMLGLAYVISSSFVALSIYKDLTEVWSEILSGDGASVSTSGDQIDGEGRYV